jgi:hypothetical protein
MLATPRNQDRLPVKTEWIGAHGADFAGGQHMMFHMLSACCLFLQKADWPETGATSLQRSAHEPVEPF